MTDSLSITVNAFVSRVSMSFSVNETLFPRYVNSSTSFRELPPSVTVKISKTALFQIIQYNQQS